MLCTPRQQEGETSKLDKYFFDRWRPKGKNGLPGGHLKTFSSVSVHCVYLFCVLRCTSRCFAIFATLRRQFLASHLDVIMQIFIHTNPPPT